MEIVLNLIMNDFFSDDNLNITTIFTMELTTSFEAIK